MNPKIGKISKKVSVRAFQYLILIGLSFIIIYPIIVSLLISFMDKSDIYNSSIRFISQNPSLKNYMYSISFLNYWSVLLKSVLFDGLACLLEICACLLVAYGFARFDFPFKKLIFGCVLLTLLVPTSIYFTPLYLNLADFGPFHLDLSGSPIVLFLFSLTGVSFKNGLLIYLMRQHFKGYPIALEEAASVDGANSFTVFLRIMLPGSVSVAVTSFMLDFVWKWTDPSFTDIFLPNQKFLWSLMSNIDMQFEMLPEHRDLYLRAILQNACLILFIAPIILLFVISKRFLVESIETTGLVG